MADDVSIQQTAHIVRSPLSSIKKAHSIPVEC